MCVGRSNIVGKLDCGSYVKKGFRDGKCRIVFLIGIKVILVFLDLE